MQVNIRKTEVAFQHILLNKSEIKMRIRKEVFDLRY